MRVTPLIQVALMVLPAIKFAQQHVPTDTNTPWVNEAEVDAVLHCLEPPLAHPGGERIRVVVG